MNLFKITRVVAALVALSMLLAACDDDGGEVLSTSSTVLVGNGSSDDGTTTTLDGATGSSTASSQPPVGTTVESFDIISRESDDSGETLFILIPQATYTDVDLENFVGELIESGTATWGAEIFDDVAALEAYQIDESDRNDKETELVEAHHFVSLVEGDTIIFRGPFESSGQILIGS